MPGRLIEVGGHRLHLRCAGSGTPTVVLEPGAGGMSSMLGWIAPAVAGATGVCVYDRAGRGWSEPASTAQDGAQIATDLHRLLERGHIRGPYVLAGHSFGGLYVLTFAARYPDQVAAMVLVDSTAPASAANPGTPSPGHGGSSNGLRRVSALVSAAARLVLAAYTPSPTSTACRHGPGTRSAPASPPKHAWQHDRRVPPGDGLDRASCRPG
jgi:pimeloyl-ACP methyl ester carboxylesterase